MTRHGSDTVEKDFVGIRHEPLIGNAAKKLIEHGDKRIGQKPHPLRCYVITEEELLDTRSYIYHEDEEAFDKIERKVRSRPVQSEREKVLDDLRWRVTTVGFEPKDEAAFLYLIDYVKDHPDEVDYLAEHRKQGEQR